MRAGPTGLWTTANCNAPESDQLCNRAGGAAVNLVARGAAVDYRKAYVRPRRFDRDQRFRIPRDGGQAVFLEALGVLAAIVVLSIAVGLTVGIPLAMALNDICASLKC